LKHRSKAFDIKFSGEKANLRSKEKVVLVVGCLKGRGRTALIRECGGFSPARCGNGPVRFTSLPTVARIRRFSYGIGISDVGLRLVTDGALAGACPPAGLPHHLPALFAG